jgi:hypothetical protein
MHMCCPAYETQKSSDGFGPGVDPHLASCIISEGDKHSKVLSVIASGPTDLEAFCWHQLQSSISKFHTQSEHIPIFTYLHKLNLAPSKIPRTFSLDMNSMPYCTQIRLSSPLGQGTVRRQRDCLLIAPSLLAPAVARYQLPRCLAVTQ